MQTTTRNRTAKVPEKRHEPVPARLKTFFSRGCTACGRQVRIPLEQLGRLVGCRHCGCQLDATVEARPETDAMMQRADELLMRHKLHTQHVRDRKSETVLVSPITC